MDMVTLGSTGITVNKNGFGALPFERISQEDAVYLARKAYYFQQAQNGLYARQAILCDVLGITLDDVIEDAKK